MKHYSTLYWLPLFFCLFVQTRHALAFQFADAAPSQAAVSSKYIFYWGKYQCDLSESNGFKGNLSLSPESFRQLLIGAPSIWNGRELVRAFTFKIEGIAISTTDYYSNLAGLNATFSPLAIPGATLHLTQLELEKGTHGTIDIKIDPMQEVPPVLYGNSRYQDYNFVNTQYLDHVVWGREDIYEISDRDYFTLDEVWKTIRMEPAIEWKIYKTPTPLRVQVNFTAADKTSMGIVNVLDSVDYAGFLKQVEVYGYLAQAGGSVSLVLQTAGQYELLYKKTMLIVENNDPRLRLRRLKNKHEVLLKWGEWSETINELYLMQMTGPKGETLPTDLPIARSSAISFANNRSTLKEAFAQAGKPVLTIDEEPVSTGVVFRLSLSDSLSMWVDANNYDDEAIASFLNQAPEKKELKIDSVRVDGYDFPEMTFLVRLLWLSNPLMPRNDWEVLNKLAGENPKVKLAQPVVQDSNYVFDLELPEKGKLVLSIFAPNGLIDYLFDETYEAGKHSVKVPSSAIRFTGAYTAFLNTMQGVAKVEFQVK